MNIRHIFIASAAAAVLCGCSAVENSSQEMETQAVGSVTVITLSPETVTEPVSEDPAETLPDVPDTSDEASSEQAGLLTSTGDIALTDLDGSGENYSFEYGSETFNACYSTDNWKITDSYHITNLPDMQIICQALIDVHPVHGSDMESFRTAEDMADEWVQHNLAFELLPDDSPWKESAKDVDLDPADQGKSMYELFMSRQ